MNSLNSTCNLSEFSLTRLIPWLFAVEFAAFGYKVRIWLKKSANSEHSNGSKANFGRILLTKVTKYTSAHCQKWILCFRIDLAVFHDIFHPFRNIFFWIYLSMIPIFWPPRWFELDNPFHTQRCVRTRICTCNQSEWICVRVLSSHSHLNFKARTTVRIALNTIT